MTVTLEVHHGTLWCIYRDLLEIGSAKALELSIEIRKDPSLEKWIIRKVDSGYDVAHAKRYLFCLCKKVGYVSIEYEAAHNAKRQDLLRDKLGSVQYVEVELVSELLIEELKPELPFGEMSFIDRVPEVAPMKVRICPGDLECLVPNYGLHTQLGAPVKLYERRFSSVAHKTVSVYSESFHHSK
jgi:hypothetical protein